MWWRVAAAAGSLFGLGFKLRRGFVAPRSCPRKTERVALVGDSLAVGLAAPLGERAKACELAAYYAEAEGGTRTQQWSGSRLDGALAFGPTLLLVSLGGNDYAHSEPAKVRAAALEIARRARAARARLVWVMPPPMPWEDNAGAGDAWRAATRFRFETHKSGVPQAADKIHPTPKGYLELAGALWRYVVWLSWSDARRP